MNRSLAALLVSLAALYSSGAAAAKPSCGSTISSKYSQLVNPANPPRQCVYHFKAYSKSVCQLRVEFAMTLAPPSLPAPDNNLTYAECDRDYLQVGNLRLCGVETKQHVYLPFNRTAGVSSVDISVVLAVRLGTADLPTASWNIRVRQLECPAGASVRSLDWEDDVDAVQPSLRAAAKDGFFVAPPGCTQYFPHREGVLTSFNYNRAQGTYPGNLNYAICFRRQATTKQLELKAVVFKMGSSDASAADMQLDSQCYAGPNEDHLMIPQSTFQPAARNRTSEQASLFCGDGVDGNTIISSNPGPLMMLVTSGTNHRQSPAGFYFSYKLK